ncbi:MULTISPECIES: SMI1/KNR4 family protein [Bacillus]|uniref:SMI1/KNR4 family protein n=2 Tax=Bacillus cereus group TaxID=86661 RepID=A0A2C1DXF9_BACCE|nr:MULTISPECIES: SMI1/KNR4 family protein [Bacillus cereus group]OFD78078.1 Antitoxin YxxD [Bacillus mycoides]OFD78094.1 Antitoxin YxxD [Bacillus mycoides]OFD79412.1 Antitoxin YxxD [Bacillus mycoides]PGT04619.1 SMI1/KNR4 family protein [Bacillus cereus]
MGYKSMKANQENSFFPVTENEIKEVEKELDVKFPKELVDFYIGIGYGFIKGSEFNINRIMDPYSVRDFRLRVNDFEFYPDIEIYDEFENNKLIFFEGSESALMSIELNEKNSNPVYYFDIQIATSLEEFLRKIEENDKYYLELLVD